MTRILFTNTGISILKEEIANTQNIASLNKISILKLDQQSTQITKTFRIQLL